MTYERWFHFELFLVDLTSLQRNRCLKINNLTEKCKLLASQERIDPHNVRSFSQLSINEYRKISSCLRCSVSGLMTRSLLCDGKQVMTMIQSISET